MKDAIKLSLQEAADLLRKWMDENRLIQVSIVADDNFMCKVHGRLDSVKNGIVHFSLKKSTMPLGDYIFVDFPLANSEFEYSHAEHAPEPLRSQLPKGYDALLYVYRRGIRLGLAVLSPAEEWL